MICAKCHNDNLADAVFCAECGARMEQACSACGTTNPPNSKFCRKCGNRLAAAQPQVAPTQAIPIETRVRIAPERQTSEAIEGERKTVTALFADIKGSTELMRDLDPEEARAIVDPVLQLMVEAVRRYEGYVVQSTGDGIFALFGAPAAYEDHPQRALYAALQMGQELREHGQRRTAQGSASLEARVGV